MTIDEENAVSSVVWVNITGHIKEVISPNVKAGIGEKEYRDNPIMNMGVDISEIRDDINGYLKLEFKSGKRKVYECVLEVE